MKNPVRGQIICPKCNKSYYNDGEQACPDCFRMERIIRFRYSLDMYNTFGIGRAERLAAEYSGIFVDCPDGMSRHHWSYSRSKWGDVVFVPHHLHFRAHNFISRCNYVFETKVGVLLDTKQKHIDYLLSKGIAVYSDSK